MFGEQSDTIICLTQARNRLNAMLSELHVRREHLEGDLADPPERDSSERAVAMEDDEPLEAQAALVTAEIASVRRALGRLDNGTYGECVRCGGEIAPARLDVRPEAALCIACANAQG